MADFDPDAYLAQVEGKGQPAAFDPDAYLAQVESQRPAADGGALETAGDFAVGARDGATLGFADEIAGAGWGLARWIAGDHTPGADNSLAGLYRQERDAERALDTRARERSPIAHGAGGVAGALVLPVPGGVAAKGASALGKIGRATLAGAGMGAAYGLGSSKADLTSGDPGAVGDALVDTGIGGLVGGTVGALGHGVVKGAGWVGGKIAKRAARGVDDAVAQERAIQEGLTEKAIRSKLGEARSATQSASRDIEVMMREADALPDGDPLKQRLLAFLDSPEGVDLRRSIAGNKLQSAPERLEEMALKKTELDAMVANKGANIELQTAEALRDPVKKHVLKRAVTLGNRYLPAVAGTIGYALGGAEGMAVGAGLGTIQSITQGAPGRIIKNLAEKPAVRKVFWEKVLAASGGATPKTTGFVRALENSALQGDKQFAVTSFILSQKHPEVREMLRKVAEVGGDESESEVATR